MNKNFFQVDTYFTLSTNSESKEVVCHSGAFPYKYANAKRGGFTLLFFFVKVFDLGKEPVRNDIVICWEFQETGILVKYVNLWNFSKCFYKVLLYINNQTKTEKKCLKY